MLKPYRQYLADQWRELRAEGLVRVDRETREAQGLLYLDAWTSDLFSAVHDRRESLPADVIASARRVLAPVQFEHLTRYIRQNQP